MSDLNKKRLKKITDLINQSKRQQGVLEAKIRENQILKGEIQ
jgi:hypothetical protein